MIIEISFVSCVMFFAQGRNNGTQRWSPSPWLWGKISILKLTLAFCEIANSQHVSACGIMVLISRLTITLKPEGVGTKAQ